MGVLLEAKSLKKTLHRFKNFKRESNMCVKDVSLCVNEGEIVGLLGPNGAGKSTSLKIITGDLQPDEGCVIFDGEDITTWPMYKRCSAGLGYMAQENTLFRQMTVENNLVGIMQMQGFTQSECRNRCEELMELFNLNHIRHNLAANISGGEKRRLEVARALTTRPKMLILDEPFAGVDPKVTQSVLDLVFDLWRNWGIAILITDHDYLHIIQMVERCYVISDGQVVFEGGVDDLINDPVVQRDYLGNIEQQIITVDEFGRKRVNSRHNTLQSDKSANSEMQSPKPKTDNGSMFQDVQSGSSFNSEFQNPLQTDNSDLGQNVSGFDSEQAESVESSMDSDLSQLLQTAQTSDFQVENPDSSENTPSATLAEFFQNPDLQQPDANFSESQFEDASDDAAEQKNDEFHSRKPLSGPSIKPFRRKK